VGIFHELLSNTFAADLVSVTRWIFVAIGALIIPIAIYFGFQLAYAEDEGKRRSVKKRLMNMLISAIIIIFLIGILTAVDLMGGFTDRDEQQRNRITLAHWTSANSIEGARETNPTHFTQNIRGSSGHLSIPVHIGGQHISSRTNANFVTNVQIAPGGDSSGPVNFSLTRTDYIRGGVASFSVNLPDGDRQPDELVGYVILNIRVWGPVDEEEGSIGVPEDGTYSVWHQWLVRINFRERGAGFGTAPSALFQNPVVFRTSGNSRHNGTNVISEIMPSTHNNHWPGHANGARIDINHEGFTGSTRLTIVAAATGTVVSLRSDATDDRPGGSGNGNYVRLRHNLPDGVFYTIYLHLAPVGINPHTRALSVGSIVQRGDPIGTMGATGDTGGATGIHLCFILQAQTQAGGRVDTPLRSHFRLLGRNGEDSMYGAEFNMGEIPLFLTESDRRRLMSKQDRDGDGCSCGCSGAGRERTIESIQSPHAHNENILFRRKSIHE